MIVGVTGTGYPFPRLVELLATYAAHHPDEEVWVQHGKAPLSGPLRGAPLVPRHELLERMRAADAVVSHGGSGALADAVRCGHVPVVVPRRAHLQEHVNDHQLEIVQELAALGRIVWLDEAGDLEAALQRSRSGTASSAGRASTALRDAVHRDLRALTQTSSLRATFARRILERLARRP